MFIRSYHQNFSIDHYPELISTNSLALELAKSYQINSNHIILADQQTNGRGRMDRNWVSPLGNLYFSLVLKTQKSATEISELSFLTAVALGLALDEFSEDNKKINYKWPNDILVDDKKVAGILLEKDADFVILGVGVNINSHPKNTNYPACNLEEQGFKVDDKIDLLKKFLDRFINLHQKWLDFGFTPIRNLWLEKAFNLNQEIAVNLPNQSLRGIFRNLDEKGNLVLEVNNQIRLIASGEVFS
ncbi:MAG: biotin--[acetyl-CoA-carboxylase] ligase [Pseudomonadota bacterium]